MVLKINFSPVYGLDSPEVSVLSSTSLLVEGAVFDFSRIQEGDLLPVGACGSQWFAGPVKVVDGVLEVTLLLPHGDGASNAALFPEPVINPPIGPLELPA